MRMMLHEKRLAKEALAIDKQGNACPCETYSRLKKVLRLYALTAQSQDTLNRLMNLVAQPATGAGLALTGACKGGV